MADPSQISILAAVAVASFFIGPRGVPFPIEFGVTVFALLSLVDLIGAGIERYRHRAGA